MRGRYEGTDAVHGLELVRVPGGRFDMGGAGESDEPVHGVEVGGFHMAMCPVTNAQYCEFLSTAVLQGAATVREGVVTAVVTDVAGQVASGTSWLRLSGRYTEDNQCCIRSRDGSLSVEPGKEQWPVVYVTWHGARAFCEHYGCALPTEAEWEFAASGGAQRDWATRSGDAVGHELNHDRRIGHPVAVDEYPANPYGLMGLSGNVWEWCRDWYAPGYYRSSPERDPAARSREFCASCAAAAGMGWRATAGLRTGSASPPNTASMM
jgi:formylglycine-generating enzyme